MRTKNKRILCSLLGILLLLPVAMVAQDEFVVVLRVNDRIATSWDYHMRRQEKIQRIRGAESLPVERKQRLLANVGVSTMDDIFEELLMLSRADQLGLRATEADMERAVAAARQNYGIETNEQFEEALAASNMTLDQFKENMERSLLVQKLMGEEVHPRVNLEEEDVRRYYQKHSDEFQEPERIHLEEVVVLSSSGLDDDEMGKTAEEIRQQVGEGGNLSQIAEPLAEQGVTSNAVDLGWVEVGDLDPQLEKAIWSLETGGVSEPVEGRGGFHILVVVDKEEARLLSFLEVEQQIRATESERLMSFEMQKYLEELEKKAYVVVNPPPDAAGFRASLQMASDSDELEEALTAPLITQPEIEPAVDEVGEAASEDPPGK